MEENQNATTEAAQETPKKGKAGFMQWVKSKADRPDPEPAGHGRKALTYGVALLLFLIATNPSIVWFLPESWKSALLKLWSGVFGNVASISRTVRINWVSLFEVVAIILLLLAITHLVKFLANRVKPRTSKGESIRSMVQSFCTYAAVVVGIVWCLNVLGVNIATIFASVGIVALIVGFAAESLIADIITGIFLVFEDEFNVGDIVEINGFRGTVESIGVRVTCVKDAGGNIKVINNSGIRDVLNRSKAASRAVVDAPISYAADLEQAENVLGAILATMTEKYPETFRTAPRYIGVQTLDSSSVNLRVIADVAEKDVFTAARLLNREIKLGLDKAGVEIPFQQVVVHQAK